MDIKEKIAIIPDTNYFYNDEKRKSDFSKLWLNRYYKLIKSFEFLEITGEVKIFIPELVLCELLSQYKKDLKNKIQKLNADMKKFEGFENLNLCEINIDIDQHCNQLKDKYIHELNIITLPEDKSKLFKELFKRALKKQAPFPEDDKSDHGFKDSILFLSLLEFAKTTSFDTYLLISDDRGFHKNDNPKKIKKEFRKYCNHHKNKLEIIKSDESDYWLMKKYKLYDDLRDFIDNEFIPELMRDYNNNALIKIGYNKYIIENCNIIIEKTRIYQETATEFEVEIYFSVDLNFSGYHPDELYGMEDMDTIIQRESYIFNKQENIWEYELEDYDYDIYYEPPDEQLFYEEIGRYLSRDE